MEQNTCCCENPGYEESGCCCGDSGKEIKIDYLYLDLNTCDRCIGTVAVLDELLDTLRPTLEQAGYQVLCQKREISNAELAEKTMPKMAKPQKAALLFSIYLPPPQQPMTKEITPQINKTTI